MGATCRLFGDLPDGKKVYCCKLENPRGLAAEIISYGARIIGLYSPDRMGMIEDIVWGYDTLEEYCTPRDSQGAIIGRFAGRISNACFELEGKTYPLVKNAGAHTLHGGTGTGACFSEKLWEIINVTEGEQPSVTLSLLSPDGEGGFPGNLKVLVTYCLTENNGILIRYEAVSDRTTVINLTSHCFFNLNSYRSTDVREHFLWVNANRYTVTGEDDLVNGKIDETKDTPLDFSTERPLGPGMVRFQKGYNHNLILNEHAFDEPAASLYDPQSGREMKVFTDQPGLQIYTAGGVKPNKKGKRGSWMQPLGAICLETQHFPDSVHHSHFPSTVLIAGQQFQTKTEYRFAVRG